MRTRPKAQNREGKRKLVDLPRQTMFAAKPRTVNVETRTVEVIAATETPVKVFGWYQVLKMAGLDASRLINAPVIDTHDRSTIDGILGQVISHRIEGDKLVSTLRFHETERGQQALERVARGELTNVSIGFFIRASSEKTDRTTGKTTETVTDWQPYEVSLVPVGADQNAKVRSISTIGKTKMSKLNIIDDNDELDDETEIQTRAAQRRKTNTQAVQIERDRVQQIRTIADVANITGDDLDDAIEVGISVEAFRTRVFEVLAERSSQTRASSILGERELFGNGANDQKRNLMVTAVVGQLTGKDVDDKNQYRGMTLLGAVREMLNDSGANVRQMSNYDLVEAAFGNSSTRNMHTTTDFPMLMGSIADKILLDSYLAMPPVHKAISILRNAPNYRVQNMMRRGEAPLLQKVTESGEIKRGTLSEDRAAFAVDSFASMFSLTKKAIVNDDLGSFADFMISFADSAVATEGDQFFRIFSANAFAGITLIDGNPLFHASRANRAAAGTALSVASLDTGRQAMRLQKNVNNTGYSGVTPAYLLVGPRLETQAERLLAEMKAVQVDQVNPFAGNLKLLVDNRYDGTGWYLFGDPAARPCLVHGYLEGYEGPKVDSYQGWDVLGIHFRCELTFGCGVQDWRAAYFNPGV